MSLHKAKSSNYTIHQELVDHNKQGREKRGEKEKGEGKEERARIKL